MPLDENTPDAALIARFEAENEVPSHIAKWFDMCAKDRKYVNDDCIRKPTSAKYAVTTNHVLINQRVVTSSIYARDPAMRFEPLPQMWGTELIPDLVTGMPTMVEKGPPDEMIGHARTLDIAVAWTFRENDMRRFYTGLIQDVQTNNLAWIKLVPQQDYTKDPLGQTRLDDFSANVALYKGLKEREAEGDLDPDCADYKRMKDLEDTIRQYLVAQLQEGIATEPLEPMEGVDPVTGMPVMVPQPDPRQAAVEAMAAGGEIPLEMLPEVDTYVGICYDSFYPEDVFVDWSLYRPEDWHKGNRLTFRFRKTPEEVRSKYKLTEEEYKSLKVRTPDGKDSGLDKMDPVDLHSTDHNTSGLYVTLYERYDRDTSRMYIWAEGVKRLLVNEVVKVTSPWWFPAVPVTKNRVTGRSVGPSDVTLQRPLQDEINEQRSHQRKIKRASIPKTIVPKGMLERGEKEKLESGDGGGVVEIKKADEVRNAFAQTQPITVNPWLTDASEAKYELQKVSGVSSTSAGVVGDAKLATEVADARQSLDSLTEFYRTTLVEWPFQDIGYATAWMLSQIWDEGHAIAVCGPGAVWFEPATRAELLRRMQLKVEPGSTGRPGGEAFLKKAMMLVDLARGLGLTAKSPAILSDIVRESGLNIDPSKYFMLAPAPMPPVGKVGTSQGEGGGAPPMNGAPTRAPEGVPNSPSNPGP